MKKQSLVRMIKNVSLSQAETKVARSNQEAISLFHNATHYVGNLLATRVSPQDDTGFNELFGRIGDEIVGKGLSLKFVLSNLGRQPDVMYKVFVFSYDTEQAFSTGLLDAVFWNGLNGAGSNMYRMLDAPATQRISILKSFTIQHQPNYNWGGDANYPNTQSTYRQVYIPLNNRKIRYKNDAPDLTSVKGKDIGFAVLACSNSGTSQLVNIAQFDWSKTLYFKDP